MVAASIDGAEGSGGRVRSDFGSEWVSSSVAAGALCLDGRGGILGTPVTGAGGSSPRLASDVTFAAELFRLFGLGGIDGGSNGEECCDGWESILRIAPGELTRYYLGFG